jgi:hypothetical protein
MTSGVVAPSSGDGEELSQLERDKRLILSQNQKAHANAQSLDPSLSSTEGSARAALHGQGLTSQGLTRACAWLGDYPDTDQVFPALKAMRERTRSLSAKRGSNKMPDPTPDMGFVPPMVHETVQEEAYVGSVCVGRGPLPETADSAVSAEAAVEGTVSPPADAVMHDAGVVQMDEVRDQLKDAEPVAGSPPVLDYLPKNTAFPVNNLTYIQHRQKKLVQTRGQCEHLCRGCPFTPDVRCFRRCSLPARHLSQGRCDCMCDVHNPRMAAQVVTARLMDSTAAVEAELKTLAMRIELDKSSLKNN